MDGEATIDFNFWPSFADMMLAIVLVLVLILSMFVTVVMLGTVSTEEIVKHQSSLIDSVTREFGGECLAVSSSTSATRVESRALCAPPANLMIRRSGRELMTITHDLHLQRIAFRDSLLFETNDYRLKAEGRNLLRNVGQAIRVNLPFLKQIDIEGHTDNWPTTRYSKGNLELGSFRAMEVFEFLKDSVHLDPNGTLMSAVSYGQFNPVAENLTEDGRAQNRRVELLLRYAEDTSQR